MKPNLFSKQNKKFGSNADWRCVLGVDFLELLSCLSLAFVSWMTRRNNALLRQIAISFIHRGLSTSDSIDYRVVQKYISAIERHPNSAKSTELSKAQQET